MYRILALLLLLALTPRPAVLAQALHDGQHFDQGRAMTAPSPRAPAALAEMQALVGQWTVSMTRHRPDTTFTTTGRAEITFMNRGYAYQERLTLDDYDAAGHPAHLMAFLAFNPGAGRWVRGEANSFTERITMADGTLREGPQGRRALILSGAVRRNGGSVMTHTQTHYAFDGPDRLVVTTETSTDHRTTWQPAAEAVYTRHTDETPLLPTRDDYGAAAADRPPEAAQFDFLVGEWNAAQRILMGGQWISFPSPTTAVYALGGHAILEHLWYDIDPSHPDAASTVLRLFNRAENRWESLYLDTRGNAPLHFGGHWQDDQMVLGFFGTDLATGPISRYVFYDITPDRYLWHAQNSTDGGQTFTQTWTMEITRLP